MTTAVPITTSQVHTARKWGGGAEVRMGGKGISGREGTGCGDLGCKGEGWKGSLGYLYPRASWHAGSSPGPLSKVFQFSGKPPGIRFIISGHRYLALNSSYLETQASGPLTTPSEPLTK